MHPGLRTLVCVVAPVEDVVTVAPLATGAVFLESASFGFVFLSTAFIPIVQSPVHDPRRMGDAGGASGGYDTWGWLHGARLAKLTAFVILLSGA